MVAASGPGTSLRIGVVGGGPAGSLFALYAMRYAERAGRDLQVTIYEGKDFHRRGPIGCNMCAGLIPRLVLTQLAELELQFPEELFLSTIAEYALHTSAGTVWASQPEPGAQVRVETIRRRQRIEILTEQESAQYDLVVLAHGVNGHALSLEGAAYRPPPTSPMCQYELYLGEEVVSERLHGAVHIFLPPDDIAAAGMMIPKREFVTVSLLHARNGVGSMRAFLALPQVVDVLGSAQFPVCACQPRISVGTADGLADDGLIAIGDAGVTRLYKNGIGSAVATARSAAWTALSRGYTRADFVRGYVPVCRAIERDNSAGRVLFLQVPALKQSGLVASAHQRLAQSAERNSGIAELHAQVLWGMFTGTYGYLELLRMALRPDLVAQFGLTLARLLFQPSDRTS